MIRIFYIFALLTFLTNCKPTEDVGVCENSNLDFLINDDFVSEDNYSYEALILNEGGYTYGNASLISWNSNGSHSQNVFKELNNYNLGDVIQSAYKTANEIYLVVNNSQKIEVIDRENLMRKRTITGFTSPRYMNTISSFALVTDLYANKINVFNTETLCEHNSIEMLGWTEQIFNINNKIYVIERSEVGAATLFANIVELEYTLNEEVPSFSILKRTSIPIEPNFVVEDGNNNIWILSAGNESNNIFPSLSKFSTISSSIEKTKEFDSFNNSPKIIYSNSELTDINLYFNQGQKIYSLQETSSVSDFSTTELFTHTAQNLYNFIYVPLNNSFLLCDAKDYISEGEVLNYSYTGSLIESIPAGVIPSSILFK